MTEKPTGEEFPIVMGKLFEHMKGQTIKENLIEFAKSVNTLCFEYPDLGKSFYLTVSPEGELIQSAEAPEKVDCTVSMSTDTNHSIMMGETTQVKAFMTGKLKIRGINPMKLQQILPKLGPLDEYYKKALDEVRGS